MTMTDRVIKLIKNKINGKEVEEKEKIGGKKGNNAEEVEEKVRLEDFPLIVGVFAHSGDERRLLCRGGEILDYDKVVENFACVRELLCVCTSRTGAHYTAPPRSSKTEPHHRGRHRPFL